MGCVLTLCQRIMSLSAAKCKMPGFRWENDKRKNGDNINHEVKNLEEDKRKIEL